MVRTGRMEGKMPNFIPLTPLTQIQMPMGDVPLGMMLGMGIFWVVVLVFLLVGIAAGIKYLRS